MPETTDVLQVLFSRQRLLSCQGTAQSDEQYYLEYAKEMPGVYQRHVFKSLPSYSRTQNAYADKMQIKKLTSV